MSGTGSAGKSALSQSLVDAFAHFAAGVMVVGCDLDIQVINAKARGVLRSQDGIGIDQDALRFHDPHLQDCLAALVTTSHEMDGSRAGQRSMTIARPSGLRPYRLTVLASMFDPGTSSPSGAVILIEDPDGGDRMPESHELIGRFGLSPAEARVVALVPLGLTKRQIAERIGISVNTVKSQILSARRKTGARNMTELVKIVC